MAQLFPAKKAPGKQTGPSAGYRRVLRSGEGIPVPGYCIVDGSQSRDPLNTGDLDTLRGGMIIGQRSANELYAPSILGVTTAAYDADGSANTSLTVSAFTATELNRRIGSSGTFKLTGPPTAAGTVATQTITYSEVNTTTGVITISAGSADAVSGSFIQPNDGSETMLAILVEETGLKVRDYDDNDVDVEAAAIVGVQGGAVDASQIINWPSDTSLQAYIRDQLNNNGQFVFDYAFVD